MSETRSRVAGANENGDEGLAGPIPLLVARGLAGGILMGLANLVTGISGGTMLLATGVYRGFIGAIAELTTLRFRLRSTVLLVSIVGAAGLGILTLAGPTKELVVDQRWVMYSLFIGLTLGGIPLVWRLARPHTPGLWGGAVAGFLVMLLMAFARPGGSAGGEPQLFLLFLSGVAGAGAMILPGVSGGYLLLLLGQYIPILSAVDQLKQGLIALAGAAGEGSAGLLELLQGPAAAPLWSSMQVVIPVGLGVVTGVVGVSNLLQWLLHRFEKPTLGALLGLLLGAVVGLWPFQQGVPPQPGEVVRGEALTTESVADVDPEDWRVEFFDPRPGQLAGAGGLIATGLALTLLIGRLGRAAGGASD